jgi:PAS domain S-box-containing protein
MKNKIKKILAIDDEENNLLVLKALLFESFPTIKFISASSGPEGLVLCRNHRPDVVLLDIVMEGMNGYEVCHILKSDKSLRQIPVVMITASKADRECKIKALECGADAFLTKPMDKSELIAQVRAMLRLKEAVDRKQNEKQRLEELVRIRTRNLELELRQRKKTEKELKATFVELEQRRKTELALFEELKAQVKVRRETELALLQSKKSFQNYFENCSIGMSVTSPEKIWLEVNHSLCQMLGYSKEELRGLTWVDLTYPEDIEKNLKLFAELSEGKLDRYEIEKRLVRKDGTLLYITLSVVCERNSDGSLHHLLTSYVDVTARHLAEETIKQEHTLLRTLIDNLPDAVYVKDLQCRKMLANKTDLKHMGYSSESEAIGKTDIEIFPGPDGIHSFEEDLSVILTGIPLINRERHYIDPNGNQHWRLSSKIPYYDENKKVKGLVGIGYDITGRKLNEEALKKSEELYRKLVEKMPDGVYKSTSAGKFVSVNPAMVTILGYDSLEELMAIDIKNELYFNSEERKRLVANLTEGGFAVFRLKRKDGSEIWVEDHSWYNKDEKGDILYHEGVLRDVTDRMRVEHKLKILSRAVEQNPASIVITDTLGQIEYVNPKFTASTGYSFNEVLGENPRILKSGSIASSEYKEMWDILLAGGEWRGEFKNKKKNGEEYFEDALISPIKDETGKITHYLAVKEDITEKKKMFDDLITAKEVAEENNRLKSAFLAMMNHELRTPLNHILGFSEMIMTGVDPENNISFASSIHASGQSLLSIVEDVFDLALVEHTDIKLRKQTFSLTDHFTENKAAFDNILRISAKHEQIKLIFSPDTRWLSGDVTADKSKINQVLTNLFKNAVKFTHKGTIEFGYKIEDGANLVFYVKDTGIGIPLDQQNIIFDFFRQCDDSFTRIYGGIGIGLAISKKITQVLNGELKVVSEPGQGSTFSLSVPVELADLREYKS